MSLLLNQIMFGDNTILGVVLKHVEEHKKYRINKNSQEKLSIKLIMLAISLKSKKLACLVKISNPHK